MQKILITAVLVCVAGCAPEQTQTSTMTAKQANQTATNAPENPQKAMESLRSRFDQSATMGQVVKGLSLEPNSTTLQFQVATSAWSSFDQKEKTKLVSDFQEMWAASNAPADPKQCPIRIVDTEGAAVGGSQPSDASDTWAK